MELYISVQLFKYIQPCQSTQDKAKNLSVIIERLYYLNEYDQKIMLDIIDKILLIPKIDKKHADYKISMLFINFLSCPQY